jgi:hypothetical protein
VTTRIICLDCSVALSRADAAAYEKINWTEPWIGHACQMCGGDGEKPSPINVAVHGYSLVVMFLSIVTDGKSQ